VEIILRQPGHAGQVVHREPAVLGRDGSGRVDERRDGRRRIRGPTPPTRELRLKRYQPDQPAFHGQLTGELDIIRNAGACVGRRLVPRSRRGGGEEDRLRDRAHGPWTAYPAAFGSIASTLSIAFIVAVLGIVIRGAAYAVSAGHIGSVTRARARLRLRHLVDRDAVCARCVRRWHRVGASAVRQRRGGSGLELAQPDLGRHRRAGDRARSHALKVRVDGTLRDRAANGRYAWTFDRGQDFAAGIWVIDAVFMIDAVRAQLADTDPARVREERYFAGARLDDDDLRDAADDDRERRSAERARHAEATASNLGLGHDIRAALADPTDDQLHALRDIVCHLLCRHYPDLIAYGAGWTDPARQQPVGDTGRHEPRHVDAIIAAELEHSLADPDPLRGIAQLVARWSAAFVVDPDGITRTKTLGIERLARKLRDALPSGDQPLRAAVWTFVRPVLSPRLTALNRDAFVHDPRIESTVDLSAHRADADLDELDLGGPDRPEEA
jgi:hypothetical protein